MAQAILEYRPEFASKAFDVAIILKSQFPPDPKDVSIDDMIAGSCRPSAGTGSCR